jgi:hypothetical protein
MTYVALGVALVALLLAWRAHRTARDLKARHERLNTRLYELRAEMHQATETHRQAVARLKFEVLRQAGRLRATEDMTVDQVTQLHPQAAAVLAAFHIGGCASCAVDGSARLDEAAAAHGGRLEPLLVALNDLLLEGADGTVPAERLRTSNVHLAM